MRWVFSVCTACTCREARDWFRRKVRMSITYHSSLEGKLLRVTASGHPESLHEVKKYARGIIMTAVLKKAEKLLVDERCLKHDLSVIDTYELGESVSKYAPRIGQAVLVVSQEDMHAELFYETVLINRGLSIKVTTNMAEAEEWLAI